MASSAVPEVEVEQLPEPGASSVSVAVPVPPNVPEPIPQEAPVAIAPIQNVDPEPPQAQNHVPSVVEQPAVLNRINVTDDLAGLQSAEHAVESAAQSQTADSGTADTTSSETEEVSAEEIVWRASIVGISLSSGSESAEEGGHDSSSDETFFAAVNARRPLEPSGATFSRATGRPTGRREEREHRRLYREVYNGRYRDERYEERTRPAQRINQRDQFRADDVRTEERTQPRHRTNQLQPRNARATPVTRTNDEAMFIPQDRPRNDRNRRDDRSAADDYDSTSFVSSRDLDYGRHYRHRDRMMGRYERILSEVPRSPTSHDRSSTRSKK